MTACAATCQSPWRRGGFGCTTDWLRRIAGPQGRGSLCSHHGGRPNMRRHLGSTRTASRSVATAPGEPGRRHRSDGPRPWRARTGRPVAHLPGDRRRLRHRVLPAVRPGFLQPETGAAVVLGPIRARPFPTGLTRMPHRWMPTCAGCRRRSSSSPVTIRCATRASPMPGRWKPQAWRSPDWIHDFMAVRHGFAHDARCLHLAQRARAESAMQWRNWFRRLQRGDRRRSAARGPARSACARTP